VCTVHALCFYLGIQLRIFCTRNCEYFAGTNSYVGYSPPYILQLCYVRWWIFLRANHSSFGFMIMSIMDASTSRWIFPLMTFLFSSLILFNLSLLYVSVIVISFCWRVRYITHLRLLSIFMQLTLSCPCVFCCF
jgi:hypothetical protein